MASKTKTSKKSKNSKLSKIINTFNPTTKRGMLMLYLLVFAVVGGGYLAYQTFAASYPPSSHTNWVIKDNVKAEDGFVGSISCRSAGAKTSYGPLVNCVQIKGSQRRTGLYSTETRIFYQNGQWLNLQPVSGTSTTPTVRKCKNMDNYFTGSIGGSGVLTVYGPTDYGQIYRLFTYKDGRSLKSVWQIKWANMNLITTDCSASGSWMNTFTWDNIQTN